MLQNIIQKKLQINAYKTFCESNNLLYTESPDVGLRHAHFFTHGDKQKFHFAITSKDTNLPFTIFNFSYGVVRTAGKRRYTIWNPFTIFVFYFGEPVPNLYIHTTKNKSIGEPFTEDQALTLNVNQSFEATHKTYAPKQYEVEALQMLDSTFVSLLSNTIPDCDIEFFDSKLFIYKPYDMDSVDVMSQEVLRNMFSVYEKLNPALQQKLSKFSFAQIGDLPFTLSHDGDTTIQPLFRFLRSNSIFIGILVIEVMLLYLVHIYITPLY
jgi:hypothetical protein